MTDRAASLRHRMLVAAACAGVGAALVLHPAGTFATPGRMDAFFGGETAPGSWAWTGSWSWTVEPFRYRILFHGIVDGLAAALTLALPRDLATYWLALVASLIASVAFAGVALDALLERLNVPAPGRLLLLAAWLAMPPVHNAVVLPVQTKEDFLAYGIFFLGLRAALDDDVRAVAVWSVLGALTRETLLLLPGAFVLLASGHRGRRYAPLALAVGVHAALRLALGAEGYRIVQEENFGSGALVAVSLFLVLGYGWVALALWTPWQHVAAGVTSGLRRAVAARVTTAPGPADVARLLPFIALPLLVAHFAMGRIVEIRISLLIAPWALVATWQGLGRAGAAARAWQSYLGALLVLVLLVALEASGAASALRASLNPHLGPFAPAIWWGEIYAQLALVAALLGIWWRARRRKPGLA